MNEKTELLKNFIVLEGLDGSGTTTQLKMMENYLKRKDIPVYTTCEPSPLPTGRLIRRILRKEVTVEPETLARLFSADRYEHLFGSVDGILTHLSAGEVVITDRYLFSSFAYQSLDCGFDLVRDLNKYPLPEYLIYLKLSPEICRQRMKNRDMEELFDADRIQKRIIENYERGMDIYSKSGMKTVVIDGTRRPGEICSEIMKAIGR
ncbi:MAG: dTMP kinase [Spirochaetales bacterium]|nr:dTMP kinase [Spirochaetales bacterium]